MFGFDDSEVKKSIGTIFVALLVMGFVPIINLIRIVPFFKEVVLGAVVVVVFTSLSEVKRGIKFALVTGMIAAVAFNVVFIPGQIILGGVMGAASGATGEAAGGMAMLSGLGAITNLIGLLFMSPIGYTIGGAIGSVLNS
ncbi:hypothetical protein ACAH01_05305 [Halomicrobium sp. HM KBTZ05]|uniref:Uncharacterized protein n=1 Tax=Halomicrobium mukohataei TaxID=57705 RepID=A0A847UDV7_9EURY|nr:hypothetical protein [Halomicrobium mukohataei]NLV11369.1 hypothetical protein [Halomicrobium mukohataei]